MRLLCLYSHMNSPNVGYQGLFYHRAAEEAVRQQGSGRVLGGGQQFLPRGKISQSGLTFNILYFIAADACGWSQYCPPLSPLFSSFSPPLLFLPPPAPLRILIPSSSSFSSLPPLPYDRNLRHYKAKAG